MATLFGIPGTGAVTSIFKKTNMGPSYLLNSSAPTAAPVSSYIGYIISIFVVIIVVLLFINYFVTPVFQLNPGGPGVIPIPGMSDGKVYWLKQPIVQLQDFDTILGEQTTNWSMSLDIFIEEPLTLSQTPRILFRRGGLLNETPLGNTLTGVAPDYNICIALAPDTTDMIVSTLNTDNNMESVIVPNVPVQIPFRVGIILFDTIMEVYVNGLLYKTRKLTNSAKKTRGPFMPPIGDMTNLGKIMNLHIWKRPITPSEMRLAKPTIMSAASFNPSPMKVSPSANCPAGATDQLMGIATSTSSTISGTVSKLANSS